MIPKVIHYCWFSGEPLPEDIEKCIESWKTHMPNYKIIRWDTSNFDVNMSKYTQEAFQKKKWAFLSDYARLWILYNHGGLYLDSDIEVFKSFDPLLDNHAFTGFESKERIAAWIFGSEKGNPIIEKLLNYYTNRSFVLPNGKLDLTPNPVPLTQILLEYGLVRNNKYQSLCNGEFTIYPMTYFCPKRPYEKTECFTQDTYAMHLFSGAWLTSGQKKRREHVSWNIIHLIAKMILIILGEERYAKLKTHIKI